MIEYIDEEHLYLVMELKSNAYCIVKVSYERAFELSLKGDLSEFVTIPQIIDMFKNGELPRFIKEEEKELKIFLKKNFYNTEKTTELVYKNGNTVFSNVATDLKLFFGRVFNKYREPMELTDKNGNTILVKVATDPNGNNIIRTTDYGVYYCYYMQVMENGRLSPEKLVYSYTSPQDITSGLTQEGIWSCEKFAYELSNRLFSIEHYKTNSSEIGGITEDNQYGLINQPEGRRKILREALLKGIRSEDSYDSSTIKVATT